MVQSTHRLDIGECEVAKTYVDWANGEPDREWQALTLLHRCAPGLAPRPLRRGTGEGRPFVVMSRVPGKPLGDAPLTQAQVAGLGEAMRRIYRSVPRDALDALAERTLGPSQMVARVRAWIGEPRGPVSPFVDQTLVVAAGWLEGHEAWAVAERCRERVFTPADGNLGNFLWDGSRCYAVDFEDSGSSDLAFEVADFVEHVSVWLDAMVTAEALTPYLELTAEERRRFLLCRRLFAVYWLLMLLPGNPAHVRNPEGTLERQANRVVDLMA